MRQRLDLEEMVDWYRVASIMIHGTIPNTKMLYSRYKALEYDENAQLTSDEITDGWHFCYDWDYMLIHTTWEEYNSCTCRGELS
jgi:hypothetical protein